MSKRAEDIIKRVDLLKSEAANVRSQWQDLAKYCLPRKAWITSNRVPGQRLDFHSIYDSTAIKSLQDMAAGFNSHLTNPSSPWFALGTKDRELSKSKAVKVWWKNVNGEIRSTLNTSNFDSSLQEFYLDAGCFGTGSIFSEEDLKDRVRFTTVPLEQIYFEEDAKGRVNRVYREFEYSIQQAWDLWGKNAGEVVTKAMSESSEKARFKRVTIIHAVYPRDDRQAGKKDSVSMPFASLWLEKSKKHEISESGFQEMPYATGRFNKRPGEVWGFSPAMNALADIRMLNYMKRILLRASAKIVDPALIAPNSGFTLPFNLNPAAMNYFNPNITNAEALKAMETKGNIPVGFDMLNSIKESVEDAFFIPLFKAFSQITPGKTMTIPEVQRRIDESQALLGPVVGRFTQEVFDPIITRVFLILFRNGVLPPPPPEIEGQELDIVYISQLAKAQRRQEIVSLSRGLETVRAVSEFKPAVLDKINEDKVVEKVWDVEGIDPELLNDANEVKLIREAQAAAAKQNRELELAGAGASAAKDLTQADKNLRE